MAGSGRLLVDRWSGRGTGTTVGGGEGGESEARGRHGRCWVGVCQETTGTVKAFQTVCVS